MNNQAKILARKLVGGLKARLDAPSLSFSEKIIFAKRLAMLVRSGIPLAAALEMLAAQAGRRQSKAAIARLRDLAVSGKTLAKAMEMSGNYFENFAVNIVAVGEASGNLAQNLEYLADELRRRRELKRNIIGALVYPALILFAAAAIVVLMAVYVFPKILPIFLGLKAQLPASTRALIAAGIFLKNYWFYFLLAGFAAAAAWPFLMRSPRRRLFFDRLVLRFLFFGPILRNYCLANSGRAASLLLRGNSDLVGALKIAGKSAGNAAYQKAFEAVAASVSRGEDIGFAMARDRFLFPPLAAQMAAAGQAGGNLDAALMYVAQMYEEEMNAAIKNLSIVIEPALMIFVGGLVGFVAISIITPVYGIAQNLRQ